MCSNLHWARVFIINTRPDEILHVGGVIGAGGSFLRKGEEFAYRGTSLIRTAPP